MPELAQHGGAYCETCVYTRQDIARIRSHAYDHGIRVIPEVDVPGHIQSIHPSHAEWLSPCGVANLTESTLTNHHHHHDDKAPSSERRSEPLDPTNEQVYHVFLPKLYEELSTRLFPNTTMIHVGGDEVKLTCWDTSPTIQAWMKQHNITQSLDLWKLFQRRLLQDVLPKYYNPSSSKTKAIVWQEVLNEGLIDDYYNKNDTNNNGTPQIVVDVWKGLDVATIQQAIQQDFAVIVSGCWYLDHLDQDWANMYFKCNILSALPNSNDTAALQRLWGGHASMWGERADETNFMSRVWPRASAVAERLWSGYYHNNSRFSNDVSTIGNFETSVEDRLDAFRCFLLSQGIPASPIRPGYCRRGHRKSVAAKGTWI
jgi:hexosaminidase